MAVSRKLWEIGPRLLFITNRKWHKPFQIRCKSSTLDDLEGQYCNRNCIGCSASFVATARFCFYWECRECAFASFLRVSAIDEASVCPPDRSSGTCCSPTKTVQTRTRNLHCVGCYNDLSVFVTKFRAAGWRGSPPTIASKKGTPLRSGYFTAIGSSSVENSSKQGQTCCLS